ncbi:MAG: NAD-dependent deacylase [Bacteroidales bacterium]|nr:NAD-dependent deacylase [Bacteroidales bacterium]
MTSKPNLIILTGAGISAESGIKTFRDMGGLWENYSIEEVATPQAWRKNPQLVLDFYNARRKQLLEVEPNDAHKILVDLENAFNVWIITQNVDDLHERAGSSNVLHLHGELKKVRSESNDFLIKELDGWELKMGDLAEDGAQLRPHIVWFGEAVPKIDEAVEIVRTADFFVIIGTSMQVYPAAGLINYVPNGCKIYYIDPHAEEASLNGVKIIQEKATIGVKLLANELLNL